MKWIGQHIWDLISRFRHDVYLDSPSAGDTNPGKFLAIDTNKKIVYRTSAQLLSDIGGKTKVYGSTIKLLPRDFLPNEDGGTSKGMFLDDTAPTGLKPGIADMELVAITDIPEGFKATHVDIYAAQDLTIEAFEMNVNASGLTSKGSGTSNTTLDITDVNATATNYLAIIVTTTATSNRVWGGSVTIALQ